mmetsp:Transcript_3875/g.7484  ORF Transcript_3875/g.7484 Transcript_3875/m.7484 type:complete len:426 (-) Transcript_3875:241-1518(-)
MFMDALARRGVLGSTRGALSVHRGAQRRWVASACGARHGDALRGGALSSPPRRESREEQAPWSPLAPWILGAQPGGAPWTAVRALSYDTRRPEDRARGGVPGPDPEEPKEPKGNALTRSLGVMTTGAVLLAGKTKWLLAGLKFTKMMPAMSMLASTGAYAFFYGWPFAAGMVGLIGIHEAGHVLVMRQLGIPYGPVVFIPFMGASVSMKDLPKDVYTEALVAFGGPVVGGAAAVGLSAAGIALESQMLVQLADFGILINLINLMPIGSMDGGRIGGAISRWTLVAGLAGGAGLVYEGIVTSPLMYLVLLSGGFSVYDRFFASGTHESYYHIPPGQRAGITGAYIVLIAVLLAAMAWNAQHKKSLRELRAENPNRELSDLGKQLQALSEDWSDDEQEHGMSAADREFFERHMAVAGSTGFDQDKHF